ncbi:MAG TPA: ABC transporter substrate-binding protein [Chloroflexia bacterium]|nr:ABC transporter substrate-binding protein [Chloroflexia bacterium]
MAPRQRTRRWRWLWGLIASLLLTGCGEPAPAPAPMRIASVLNLTGTSGIAGAAMEKAVALAVQQQNAAGGVQGRPLLYQAYDGASQPEKTAAATGQALAAGAVALIGFSNSSAVLSAAPLAEKGGIPLISVGATSPQAIQAGPTTVFLVAFGDNTQAAAGAEFLYYQLHARRLGLLTNVGNPYTLGLSRYFQARWQTLVPGGVVFSDTFQVGDRDFSASTARLRAIRPPLDALYIAAGSQEAAALLLAVRQAGLAQPIMGGDSYGGAGLVHQIGGQPMSNIYYTAHSLWPPPPSGPLHDFAATYQDTYGQTPANVFAALAYDGTRLLLDALHRAPDTRGASIRAALEATTAFPGITGLLSFQPGPAGHIPRKAITVIAVQAGQAQIATIATPMAVPVP